MLIPFPSLFNREGCRGEYTQRIMLIYNKQWLDNLSIRKAAEAWVKCGRISVDEYNAIEAKYPSGYKPHGIGARIGLFIFGVIIVSSASGLLFLFTGFAREAGIGIQNLLLGIACYIIAEHYVRNKNQYRSGVVDALLYSAITAIGVAIFIMLDRLRDGDYIKPEFYLMLLIPLIGFAAIRFADAFLTLVVYGLTIWLNALLVLEFGSVGQMILPFECMALSVLIYFWVKKQKENKTLEYYARCLWMIEMASALTFYLAGNYMVVRMLSEALLNMEVQSGEDIHLAFFFYLYTIAVPIAYIYAGLKNKNRLLLRLGVLLIAAGILSIKYYHHVLPPETALILAGVALVAIAWFSIKYFKVPRNGITSEPDESLTRMDAISNIAFSELLQQGPTPPVNDVDFGGGSFGGGGASSGF